MSQFFGFLFGIIVVSVTCGFGSYLIWDKQTRGEHSGKQFFFAFFSFFMGGLFGLIGGVPALVISFFAARYFRNKIQEPHSERKNGAIEDKEAS